jgi:hypothetical protein
MHFLVKIDSDFIHRFLFLIEKECRFEGKAHDASIISNLIPLVEMITHEWQNPWEINDNIKEETKRMIDAILDFNPPVDLFNHQSYYPNLLFGASPKSILKFFSNIENSDGWTKFLTNFMRILYFIKKKLDKSELKKLMNIMEKVTISKICS